MAQNIHRRCVEQRSRYVSAFLLELKQPEPQVPDRGLQGCIAPHSMAGAMPIAYE